MRVIAENGYYHAQVAKIAKEAGVADGTIYLYFANKEDILITLIRETVNDIANRVEAGISSCRNAGEQLEKLIEIHLSHLYERPDLAVLTQLELRQSQPALRKKISSLLTGYLSLIEQIIQSGIEEQLFNRNLDQKLARQMVFGTIDQVVTSWVMNGQKGSLPDEAGNLHSMLYAGLGGKPF